MSEQNIKIEVTNESKLDDENKKRESRIRDVFFENLGMLTIGDLSFLIQVPEKTIRDWVYKRQIPFKKVGNLIRFVPTEIHQWIEERSTHVDRGS